MRLHPHVEPSRPAITVAVASGAVVLITGLIAWTLNAPALAPPLGVTAFLCFRDPTGLSSNPRNMIGGHALGLASGWAALLVSGSAALPDALSGGFTLRHALGSALAITLTAASTDGLRFPHPPAAATTLVVSLGLLRDPLHVAAFSGGVLVTTATCHLLGRFGRLPRTPRTELPGRTE